MMASAPHRAPHISRHRQDILSTCIGTATISSKCSTQAGPGGAGRARPGADCAVFRRERFKAKAVRDRVLARYSRKVFLLAPLPFGPLTGRTLHLCIDMQNLFAAETPWHTPWMARVLPVVTRIVEHCPSRTVFTRFIPPHRPDQMPGSWRRYYEHWRDLTLERIDRQLIELVPSLAMFVPPAEVVDKRTYSPFAAPQFLDLLRRRRIDSLIITGAETDVCVLAAVLDAVDLGYRVVLATDALCSSWDETHDALLTLYRDRFSQQIETATSETILATWDGP
jgi:nicotinamidase-related amidase